MLSTFQPREWKAFAYFLESRVLRHRAELLHILAMHKDAILAPGSADISLQGLHSAVLGPEAPFEAQEVRYLLADLSQQVEAFWIEKALREQPVARHNLLIGVLKKRRLTKLAGIELRKAKRKLAETPRQNMDTLVEAFRLRALDFDVAALQDNRSPDHSLREVMAAAELLHRAARLKYGNVLVNLRNVVATPVTEEEIHALRRLGEDPEFAEEPVVRIYYHILLTLTEPETEAHYHHLKAALLTHGDSFQKEALNEMYAFALNYSIKKLNQGRSEYLQELFDLYIALLEREIIFEENYILQQHFKNIVTVGIRLQQYGWTEDFIVRYSKRIEPDARKNAYTYNMAALYYAKGAYSGALKLLREVEFTDIYYHLDSKSLLLKTYFELRDWEPFMSLIEAFRIYLRRNKMISDYQRKVYLNFLKYAKRLSRLLHKRGQSLPKLIAEMDRVGEIADLGWLRRKALAARKA